ncbi:MAG: saccharopine dehydrogenase NADP-binding domain-containing protein [Saprospiraceae bacterium]
MKTGFLIYGANGFVGREIAFAAVEEGFLPILAGRNEQTISRLANQLGLEYRVFDLNPNAPESMPLEDIAVVLNCAGPYKYTYRGMVEGCLFHGAHYLDITGEIPVFQAIQAMDAQAQEAGVMLMPGVGFDVVPTDCLALYLKEKLPNADQLRLAYQTEGPAKLPPGTASTMFELLPHGVLHRKNGKLQAAPGGHISRQIDFGNGPLQTARISWGDVFTAYFTTDIPNIENYLSMPGGLIKQMRVLARFRFLFRFAFVRNYFRKNMKVGSTSVERAASRTHVWGEVSSPDGGRATALLFGPEAGVEWTTQCALGAVRKVLEGHHPAGYKTPAAVFGADFVLETRGVVRVDR